MVDAQCSRKLQGCLDHLAEGLVTGFRQFLRVVGRLSPRLSLLGVHVRWGTHVHSGGEDVSVSPRLRALRVDPHRQVSHHPDFHAEFFRFPVAGAQLRGGYPLAPLVEVNFVLVRFSELGDRLTLG